MAFPYCVWGSLRLIGKGGSLIVNLHQYNETQVRKTKFKNFLTCLWVFLAEAAIIILIVLLILYLVPDKGTAILFSLFGAIFLSFVFFRMDYDILSKPLDKLVSNLSIT